MDIKTIVFDDEFELKKMLDSHGFRYGEVGSNDKFVIVYRDNKSGALIYQGIYDSPIVALRDLNTIVPQIKIPLQDIAIQLVLAFNPSDMNKKPYQWNDLILLSPYMYFKKQDLKNDTPVEDKKDSK